MSPVRPWGREIYHLRGLGGRRRFDGCGPFLRNPSKCRISPGPSHRPRSSEAVTAPGYLTVVISATGRLGIPVSSALPLRLRPTVEPSLIHAAVVSPNRGGR